MSHSGLAVLSGNRKHGRILEERKLLSAASSSKPMTLLDLRDLEPGLDIVRQSRYKPELLHGRLSGK
jgi:hypothetical protein